jgi:hypothetical protein
MKKVMTKVRRGTSKKLMNNKSNIKEKEAMIIRMKMTKKMKLMKTMKMDLKIMEKAMKMNLKMKGNKEQSRRFMLKCQHVGRRSLK